MSRFAYVYDVGVYRGRTYQIGVRAEPSLDAISSFAAILFFERWDGERVEVAKIDNAEHDEGRIHFDRYYRAEGTDAKDFDVDIGSVWEAEDHLEANWLHYARTYEENHGTTRVA